MNQIKQLIERAKAVLSRARARFTALDITMSTFEGFSAHDSGVHAAALTYYTFFSIFPLLLFAAAVVGFLTANNDKLQQDLIDAGVDAFPMLRDVLKPDALDAIEKRRQELAATGAVLALYSGTGAIVALQHALNQIHGIEQEEPNWLQKRVRALKWLLLLGIGALASVALGSVATFSAELFGLGADSLLGRLIGHATGFAVGILLFAGTFKLLPAKSQSWGTVLPGAIVAAFLFELLKIFGSIYLESGARAREAAFGAVAAAAALLVASYLIAQITLLAAEFNGVLGRRRGTSPD